MAGIQIVIPGADFSASGLPRNTRFLPGTELPAAAALGLFLLEEGTADASYDGLFENAIPGSAPGRLLTGWTAPQMKNFGGGQGGLTVTGVNGTLIDTRISAARSAFTMAMVLRNRSKTTAVTPYNLLNMASTDTANAFPASNASNLNLNASTAIWGIGATLNTTLVGPFQRYGPPIVGGGNSIAMSSTLGVKDQWNAFAISVDGPGGLVRFQTLTDYRTQTDVETGLGLIYSTFVTNLASRDGNFVFGVTPNGTGRDTPGPLGDVMCAAVYGAAHSGTGIETILRGLSKIATARGVTVAGY